MTLAKVAKEAVLGLVKGNDAETNEAHDDDASLFVSGSGNALDLSSRLISAHLDRVIPHERVRGRGGHRSRRSNSESQCHVEKSRQVMSCTFKAETACSNSSTAQLDHHRSSFQTIDYTSARGGVTVLTSPPTHGGPSGDRGGVQPTSRSASTLLVASVEPTDSGKYSCRPSNAEPVSVTVHILDGE